MATATKTALIETASRNTPAAAPALPGWLPPFAVAVLVWSLLALLGALANYGDARRAAAPASLASTLLRFVLQHLPLAALSLALALGFHRAERQRLRLVPLLRAYLAALLVFLPLLCWWQSVVNRAFSGKALAAPLVLLAQQSLLTWWFNALTLTVAFGAHMAYGTWRRAHVQTLAWQQAQQVNLGLRLRLLQGQLEPRFLSSSLAGIGQLIGAQQRGDATRALARLSDLLRYALRASQSDWQSVADEVQFLRDYVALQSICHGAAVPVRWQLEQRDWADLRCPPLLLFPMLEQALGGSAAGGITVSIAVACGPGAHRVQVEVRYQQGVGRGDDLDGLRKRLAMLEGGCAGLSTSAVDGVTALRLEYPVSRHDD
jgi:hypothetical protein